MRDVPDRKPSPSLFTFWWGCIKAGSELDGHPLHPDDLILQYSANGTSCSVFVKDLDEVCKIVNNHLAEQNAKVTPT